MKRQILPNGHIAQKPAKRAIVAGLIIASFLLTIMLFLLNKNINWPLNIQTLPNIMPILMALIAFFTIGYSIICMLTSQLFNNLIQKNKDYSYLEY